MERGIVTLHSMRMEPKNVEQQDSRAKVTVIFQIAGGKEHPALDLIKNELSGFDPVCIRESGSHTLVCVMQA